MLPVGQLRFAWSPPEWVVATSLCQSAGRYPPPHGILKDQILLQRIVVVDCGQLSGSEGQDAKTPFRHLFLRMNNRFPRLGVERSNIAVVTKMRAELKNRFGRPFAVEDGALGATLYDGVSHPIGIEGDLV